MRTHARWLAALTLAASGCSSKGPAGASKVEPADAACERAGAMIARAPELRASGRVDRARRVIERAASMCPAREADGWAERLAILADLGAREEALALADKVDGAASAPPAAKQAAGAARRAFDSPPPDGDALVQQGLRALAQGNVAEGQRALDRGRAALERAKGKPMVVAAKGTIEGGLAERAFRPDGAVLAIAHDRFITLVPMDPTTPTSTFAGHMDRIRSMQWMPDKKRLVSASADGAILLWDAETSKVERRYSVSRGNVQIAVSGDGLLLGATGAEDQKLVVMRIEDGARTIDVDVGESYGLDFVPGRQEVWIGRSVGFAWFDLRTGKEIHTLGAVDSPHAMAPNGHDVAIVVNEHDLVIERNYGRATGPVLAKAPGCQAHLYPSFFTPDGKTLVVARRDGVAIALSVPGGQSRWQRTGLADTATFSRDAELLATPVGGKGISIQRAKTGEAIATLTPAREVTSVLFSPDGKHLVTTEGESGLSVFRLDKPSPLRTLGHVHGAVLAARAAPGRLVIAEPKALLALSADTPKALWSVPVSAKGVVVEPSGARAAVDEGEEVKLWDIGGSSPRATIAASTYHRLLPSAEGAAVNAEKGQSFTLKGGAQDRDIPALWHRSTLTADGRKIVGVTENDGRIGVWDVERGALQCQLGEAPGKHEPWPEEAPASRDGSTIVALFKDEIKVYAGCGGAVKKAFPTGWHGRPAGTSAVSDDGRYLFFIEDIGPKLHVWDLDRGTHSEAKDPRFSRISQSPGGDVLVWSKEDAALWKGPDAPLVPLSIRGVESASWARGRLFLGTENGSVVVVDPRSGRAVAKIGPVGASRAMICSTESGAFEVFGDPGDALFCDLAGVAYPIEVCRERLSAQGLLNRVLLGDAEPDP